MAHTEVRLGAGRPTDTNNLTIYTAPALTSVWIKSIAIANTTTSDATCRVFLTPSGGTSDQTTAILYDFTILANCSVFLNGIDQVLATGGTIVVRSSTGSALTFTASGVTIT